MAGKNSFLDFFKIKNLDDDEDEFEDDLFDEDEDDEDESESLFSKARKNRQRKAETATAAQTNSAARSTTGYGTASTAKERSSYSQAAPQQRSSYQASSAYQTSAYSGYSSGGGKLVDINSGARARRSAPASNEVYVIKPTDLSDAQSIADFLKSGMTIVINMEGMELSLAQRIIDIVFGAVYAINGTINPISNNIFIAAPDSIEVTGDFRNEILNQTSSPQIGR